MGICNIISNFEKRSGAFVVGEGEEEAMQLKNEIAIEGLKGGSTGDK